MWFWKTAESYAEKVRGKWCYWNVFFTVHDKSVIDFVRENHKLMFSCKFNNLFKNFLRVEGTGRIVRVDDNDSFCLICNLASHIFNIRIPFRLFITYIVNSFTTGKCCGSCPEGVIRWRNKNFISVVEECLHTEIDKFAYTVSGIYVIYSHIRNIFKLCILHDCFSCRINTLWIRISLWIFKFVTHIYKNFFRGFKSKRSRVSDIKFKDFWTLGFHSVSLIKNGTSYIIKYIIKFWRFF